MKQTNILSYKGYTGHFEFEPEDRLFYGRVVNTKDTITFQSDDFAKIEEEFRTSVDTYIEFCSDLGEEPEKPYSGECPLKISRELHRSLVFA